MTHTRHHTTAGNGRQHETEWIITLRPLPDTVPATVRLRAALKTLLRCYRLRCTNIDARPPPLRNGKLPPKHHKLKHERPNEMAKLSDIFPSNFLKAEDLGDRDRIVTIDRIEIEEVGKEREEKPVVYFRGGKKGLILNKTNAVAISAIAGSEDLDDWPGVQIMLVTAAVDFRGTLTNAVRVKAPTKAKPVAPPPPITDSGGTGIADVDGIPF
jgi:hypothetical protein